MRNQEVLETETDVEFFAVDQNKARHGGAFFKYLNLTLFNLDNGLFKAIGRYNYKHNCLYLALKAGGLSDIKLQHLILTLRNRTIHKCDLTNVCKALEISIGLVSLKDEEVKSRVEHYPPGIEFQE